MSIGGAAHYPPWILQLDFTLHALCPVVPDNESDSKISKSISNTLPPFFLANKTPAPNWFFRLNLLRSEITRDKSSPCENTRIYTHNMPINGNSKDTVLSVKRMAEKFVTPAFVLRHKRVGWGSALHTGLAEASHTKGDRYAEFTSSKWGGS